MKSGFTPMFTQGDINNFIDQFVDRTEEKILEMLKAAGEEFVKYARESGRYIDHTGNLRSSIGYVIVRNGSVAYSDFRKQNVGTEGNEGVEKAKRLARELAATHSDGLVLIGLAGMEYAVYVEAIESKDVITAANIKTEDWMRTAIKTVTNRM
jgi:hypothetical protein